MRFDADSPENSGAEAKNGRVKGKLRLQREFTVFSTAMYVAGSIIGAGIFVTPRGVLQRSGSVGMSLIVWTLCGIVSYFGALCFAELGLIFPNSGGTYTYIKETFGECAGFYFLWSEIIIRAPTSHAIMCLTFAVYVLYPVFESCTVPLVALKLLAAVLGLTTTVCLCYRMKFGVAVTVVVTVTKIGALIVIIVAGAIEAVNGNTANLDAAFEGTTLSWGDFALAMYYGLYAYIGWDAAGFAVEEMKNPQRVLPRGILLGLTIVTVVYLLTNLAYFIVMTKEEINTLDAVAVVFGQRTLGVMYWIMPLAVSLSVTGNIITGIYRTSRCAFVSAREKQLPPLFAMLNIHYHTPIPPMIFNCLLIMVALTVKDLNFLLAYYTFFRWLLLLLAVFVLVWVKWKQPDKIKHLKFPMFVPVVFIVWGVFMLGVTLVTQPMNAIIGIGLTLISIPIYIVVFRTVKRPKILVSLNRSVTLAAQRVLLLAPEDVIE